MDKTYDQPAAVSAQDGLVHLDGLGPIAIVMTPDAALETAERLVKHAVQAAGQRRMVQLGFSRD